MAYNSTPSFPPVDCLVAALVAARTGSFTQAAIELGVSHAAISRRIAGAESWAAIRLFVRHGRGVRVTEDGQRLLSRVTHAFDIVDQAANQWRKPPQRKTLRITTTHTLARLWLVPRIAEIEAAVSDVRIDILAGQSHADLATGEADIAIRCGKGGWKQGREERLFQKEELHPIASRHFLDKIDRALTVENVLKHPLIHSPDTSGWQTWAQSNGIAFRGKNTDRLMGDYSLATAAAAGHLGIALNNAALTPQNALQPDLIPLDLPSCISPLSYIIIVPPQQETEAVRACVQHLLEVAAMSELSNT
jgi:LysR family transcriptional regulator, glycine cleavage system transcriptional activator